jgi:hypothetical protein
MRFGAVEVSTLQQEVRSNANFKPISIASSVSVGNGKAKQEKNLYQEIRTIFR